MAWHRADECSRRLAKIPSVGPIGAALLRMKAPEPELFRSGRQFAAWIGLTPKDHSTAGKVRLGVIRRAGDEGLRSVLVTGATAVIQQARRGGRASPWLAELLKRKTPKLAAVALANKTARIAWKLMVTGETYITPRDLHPPAWQTQSGDQSARLTSSVETSCYPGPIPGKLHSDLPYSAVFRYVTPYVPRHAGRCNLQSGNSTKRLRGR
jgi:hypothetical protein